MLTSGNEFHIPVLMAIELCSKVGVVDFMFVLEKSLATSWDITARLTEDVSPSLQKLVAPCSASVMGKCV